MPLFNRKKEPKLDEELAKVEEQAPAPPPEPQYVVNIVTALETIHSKPQTLDTARASAKEWANYGVMVMRGGQPTKYIPPHQIYEITFTEYKE